MLKIVSASEKETAKLAAMVASHLKGGETLALHGHLGSGKTAFVKGLAKGLGTKTRIQSPTFVIVQPHKLKNSRMTLYHFDLYRLKNERELVELGFRELISNPRHINAVEWAEKAKALLPKNTAHFKFSRGRRPDERIIQIWPQK
jgi:tRNA threonylcarbamoyladenosine biosynthesis protein TsaE